MIALLFTLILGTLLWALGRRLLRLCGFVFESTLEEFCFSMPLGFGGLTLAVFLMGVLKLYTPLGGWLLLAAIVSLCFTDIKRVILYVFLNRCFLPGLGRLPRWEFCLLAVILVLYFLLLISSLAPPTGFDNTVYHLTVPKIFIQNEGLVHRDDVWVHKTGGFYMVYLIGMLLHDDTMAKLSIFLATVVATLGMYAMGRRFFSHRAGLYAAFLFGTTPLIGVMTGEYLEMAVIMYGAAAVHAFLLYAYARQERMLFLIPIFIGLAISTKITAFPIAFLALPALVLMIRRSRGARGRLVFQAAAALTLGVLFGFFWFFWNYFTTGRWVFPYSGSVFDPAASSGEMASQLWKASLPDLVSTLKTYLGYVFVMGEYWNESIGPVLLFALVATLVFVRHRLVWGIVGLMAGMLVFYTAGMIYSYGFTSLRSGLIPHARYASPMILSVLPVAAGYTLIQISERRRFLQMVVAFAMLVPVIHVAFIKAGKVAVQVPVVLGLESRDAYLKKKVETYEASRYINQNVPPDARILAMAFRPYFLDRNFIHAPPRYLTPYYTGLRTREELLEKMRMSGITHVLYETMGSAWPYAEIFAGSPAEDIEIVHRRMDAAGCHAFFDPENFDLLWTGSYGDEEAPVCVRVYRFRTVPDR